MELELQIIPIGKLTTADSAEMFELMLLFYDNLNRTKFESDLSKKHQICLIRSKDTKIQGFTTFSLETAIINNKQLTYLYSGDTILRKQYWGQSTVAFKALGEIIKYTLNKKNEETYWFLITKGFRTYQLLPLFFKEFYPNCTVKTPLEINDIIDYLSHLKFGAKYEINTQIIKAEADYLKHELNKITDKRKENKHINFFIEKNKNYIFGDEMPCVARIETKNFTNFALRYM